MRKIFLFFCIVLGALFVQAKEPVNAETEIAQAKTAIEEERYTEALQHLARVQVFCYSDQERMPEALYYEALIEHKRISQTPAVSAFEELCQLYPESPWCNKARAEFGALSFK